LSTDEGAKERVQASEDEEISGAAVIGESMAFLIKHNKSIA
jgi:hypothetical protein